MTDPGEDQQLGFFASEPEPAPEPEPAEPEPESTEPEPSEPEQPEPPESEQAQPPPAPEPPPAPKPPPAPLPDVGPDDLLAGIVGQPEATKMLRAALTSPVPAYIFVGPAGAGIRDAACRFAGELLAQDSDMPATQRRLALAQQHPDLTIFERVGPYLSAEQARTAVQQASKAPVSGSRKVMVVCDLHLALTTASILLKAVEEPTASTIFILLAEQIPPHLQTLNSRSVRIDFVSLNEADIAAILQAEGAPTDRLDIAARACGGSIDRARLLTSDDAALARIDLWRSLLDRLDGSGAKAAALADEVLAAIDSSAEPLKHQHKTELAEQEERAAQYSITTVGGAASTRDRHKRELRRLTTDELLMGFAVLAEEIRGRSIEQEYSAQAAATRLQAVRSTADLLLYNINSRIALQNLMLQIGPAETVGAR